MADVFPPSDRRRRSGPPAATTSRREPAAAAPSAGNDEVSAELMKQTVAGIEEAMKEIAARREDIREHRREAKEGGVDMRALSRLIKDRALTAADRRRIAAEEEQAALYARMLER